MSSILNTKSHQPLLTLKAQAYAKQALLDTLRWILPQDIPGEYFTGVSIQKETLAFTVQDASHLTRLHYAQSDVLRELKKIPECQHFKKLYFKVQIHLSQSSQSLNAAPKRPARFFPESVLSQLQSWHQHAEQSDLKQALFRLLQRHSKEHS